MTNGFPQDFLVLSIGCEILMRFYVDDNLIAGPSKEEVRKEKELILKEFVGRTIEPKMSTDSDGNSWCYYDILG